MEINYVNMNVVVTHLNLVAFLQVKKGTKKEKLPDAPFCLTSDELKVADKRAGNVQVPVGYGWSPRPLFAKYSYMKSHDWKQVC